MEPAHTNPHTGYRRCNAGQATQAQVIRCCRDLDMPLPEVKAVVAAESTEDRNAIIAAHLTRMEDQLRKTNKAVQALGDLLAEQSRPIHVELRSLPCVRVWTLSAMISLADYDAWFATALQEIRAAMARSEQAPRAPLG
ncbi:MAG: MerR family DNA-binding protein [Mycobacterium sp.]